MNSLPEEPAGEPATPVTAESAKGILTREQGSARAAFTDFCWNLQLAHSRNPKDPALPKDSAAVVSDLLERDAASVRAEGEALYKAWIDSDGEKTAPAIFRKEDMNAFLGWVDIAREHHARMKAFYASIDGKAPPPVQSHPKGEGLSHS